MAVSGMPFEAFIAETLALEFKAIQPPDYWTTVRDAQWPDYPAVIGDNPSDLKVNPAALASQEMHSVRLWSPRSGLGTSREQNNAELTIGMRLLICWVIKCSKDIARQIFLARSDIRTLMFVNAGRDRPGYAGANNWGLTVFEESPIDTDHLDPGLAVLWGSYIVESRAPIHKG